MKAKSKTHHRNRVYASHESVTHVDFRGSHISENTKGVLGMTLSELSRCTGFPPAVLRNFVAQGILPCTASTLSNENRRFDAQALLRVLVEVENAR